MRRIGRRYIQETVELNITAFLNLMVILVPFLLITAVFSRITVLELNLPPKDARAVAPDKIELQLELVVRKDSFEIRDANLGRIKHLPRSDEDTDWKAFSDILLEIKSRFPDEKEITILLERGIRYATLIQVMDRVHSAETVQIAEVVNVELFPNISIGDASPGEESGKAAGAKR